MATTPEGKVKSRVSKLLDSYGRDLYYNMPVPAGYGRPMLDYIGWFRGHPFAIETKAPPDKPTHKRREPTKRQEGTMEDMEAAGAAIFVIDDDAGIAGLQRWLDAIRGPLFDAMTDCALEASL